MNEGRKEKVPIRRTGAFHYKKALYCIEIPITCHKENIVKKEKKTFKIEKLKLFMIRFIDCIGRPRTTTL